MDLIQVGHRPVLLRQSGGPGDIRDIAVHRVDTLEGDQLRGVRRRFRQQRFEVSEVVVPEDLPGSAAMPDAGDHGGVVQLVGEDDQAGHDPLQRRQGRLVGDIARGEQQGRFLAVQVCEFGFELDVMVGRAGDVPRAA